MKETFGSILKKMRTSAGITQMDLAKMLGLIDNSMISKMEKGTRNPSAKRLYQLVEVFPDLMEHVSKDEELLRLLEDHRHGTQNMTGANDETASYLFDGRGHITVKIEGVGLKEAKNFLKFLIQTINQRIGETDADV